MTYLVLINGLIDSFNPCAIGVMIFYLALILSLSTQRRLLLGFGLFYILSIFTTYLLIGLGLLKSFHFFGIHNFFGWVAALLIILLGLYNLKEYFFPRLFIPMVSPFLSRCRIPRPQRLNLTIASALILGVLVGICEFPCSGGIYLATVALLSAKKTFSQGIGYLLLYNLMFALPLIFILLAAGNRLTLDRLRAAQAKNAGRVKLAMGISMLVGGLALIAWLIK